MSSERALQDIDHTTFLNSDIPIKEPGMGISTEILIKGKQNRLTVTERAVSITYYDKIEIIQLLDHGIEVMSSTLKP